MSIPSSPSSTPATDSTTTNTLNELFLYLYDLFSTIIAKEHPERKLELELQSKYGMESWKKLLTHYATTPLKKYYLDQYERYGDLIENPGDREESGLEVIEEMMFLTADHVQQLNEDASAGTGAESFRTIVKRFETAGKTMRERRMQNPF